MDCCDLLKEKSEKSQKMDSAKMDDAPLLPNRPIVPPKPDKDKISLTGPGSGDFNHTSLANETICSLHKSSPNAEFRQTSFGPKPPTPSSFTNKPALPPKPSPNSRLSLTSPQSSSSLSPNESKISPPLLPKGRNSLSIANAILANRNSTLVGESGIINANAKASCQTQTSPNSRESSKGRSPTVNNNIRSPSVPLSPRPVTNLSPRPISTAFTLSKPNSPGNTCTNINLNNTNKSPPFCKSASLGRNFAPPPTSPTGIGQFFTSKAATLARMLPLDLNFGKHSPTNASNKFVPTTHSNSSQHPNAFGRNSNLFSSPIPPPPPPRLKKKLSPVNSLSPTSNPTSPVSPPTEAVIYAEVDKEKKWAERRLKKADASLPATLISVEKVEERFIDQKQEEQLVGSLLITINRDSTEPQTVSVQTMSGESHSFKASQMENKTTEAIIVDSWLGNYLKNPVFSGDSSASSQPKCQMIPESKPEETLSEVEKDQKKESVADIVRQRENDAKSKSKLGENKSFLFSALSTVDNVEEQQKDATKSESAESIIQSVEEKIQSAVSLLSNLSGKNSPVNQPEEKEEKGTTFESLTITEASGTLNKSETCSSDICIGESNNEATIVSSVTVVRRRSWNCSDSSSPCDSSSSSLTNLREKPKQTKNLGWVDEGDSTGVLGDIESSDAGPPPNSSNEDVTGSSFSLRRIKKGIFSSFGKAATSSSSSSNGSNSNGYSKTLKKERSKVTISSPMLSPPSFQPGNSNQEHGQQQDVQLREKSHSVQFSPDTIANDSPVNRHSHRYSEGSIDSAVTNLSLPSTPGFGRDGDSESLSSFSSVSTGLGSSTITGYEDIIAELSLKDRKSFYVAREIFTSEQTFVDVLNLLTVDFPQAIRSTENSLGHPIIPPQDLDAILAGLSNLKRVNEELKNDLEHRIEHWRENPKLADVIVKKGPFLKLYSHYIKNFEKTTLKLDQCCQQYEPFMKGLQEFERSDRCRNLGLKHYMLKPVQRMPQYRLLLEDYLKHLEEDGVDFEDTVKALGIVKDVAEHANEAIKLQVNAEKLLNLQNRMTGAVIMKADRQLLKEGELLKVCRKDLQPRFFALMNDCLFCLTYHVGTGSAKDLKLRNELPLAGMKVCLSVTEDNKNEFSVISTARSFNLVAKSAREREEWMKALNNAIHDNIRKRTCHTPEQEEGFQLGKIAPVWIADGRVTMCQICTAEFSMTFRRHHCRSCGKVVCGYCSGNQAPLQYLKNDSVRVCDECYQYLLEEFDKETRDNSINEGLETSRETIRTRFKKVTPNVSKRATKFKRNIPARLEVHANNFASRISGYLHWRERKAWKRHWFVLMDRVLYIYAASEDVMALRSIPVLGWNVDYEKSECMDNGDSEAVFKLTHLGQNTLLFQADNPALAERWVSAMQEATILT